MEVKQLNKVVDKVIDRDYGKALILGQSGYGKTYMFRNCDETSFGFINAERKPLPFRKIFKYHGRPANWMSFIANLEDFAKNPEIEMIGVDSQSAAFDMLYQECQANFKGYDIYSTFNRQVVQFFNLIRDIQKDMIITGHDEILLIEGYKQKRAKIHGKQYEGRVESLYTICMYADKEFKNNEAKYFLRTMAPDTSTKVPPDMFGKGYVVENDAAFIFKKMREYYSF